MEERVREVFSSASIQNFLFVEVSYEYVMVAWLKEAYRANTIALYIVFV